MFNFCHWTLGILLEIRNCNLEILFFMDILTKIKKAGLVGRGGACFPTADKWEMVKKAKGKKKYVVCNASEGEPGVAKDSYILENFPEEVINGIKIAIDFLGAEEAYIYINHNYYKKFNKNLIKAIDKAPIELFIKPIRAKFCVIQHYYYFIGILRHIFIIYLRINIIKF